MAGGACSPAGVAGPTQKPPAEGATAMKKDDVQIGGTYLAKVGARSVEVRIDSDNAKGGWNATATGSGKPVRVKDVRHLRPVGAAEESASDDADVVPLTKLDKERKSSGKPKGGKAKVAKAPREKKPAKEKAPAKPKAMSCLDAAAAVLKAKGEPMACRAMIDAMHTQGLWKSDAPTPHATLFSALLREIKKGAASRVKKVDRGQFAYQEPKKD